MCFVFVFHLNFHFLSKFIYVLFSFHSKIYTCVLFGKSPGSSPSGEFSHFPSSHFVQFICAHCGGSGEVSAPGWTSGDCQATQIKFSGAFHYSSHPCLSISNPFYFFPFSLSDQKSKLLANQSVTGRRIA